MKKITLLFFMMICFSFSFAQVQVGTETNELQGLPIEPYYGYSYGQSIYLASDINTSGTITAIQWYFSGTTLLPNSQDLTIYMATSARTEYTSNTDWEPIASFTQVYSGTLPVGAAPGWVTLTLDTPFVYDGTSNLIIASDENMAGYDNSADDFHNSATATARSIYYRNDATNPDPTAPPTATGTASFVPNIIFNGLVAANPPNCDAVLTSPANGEMNANLTAGLTWSAATGSPTGYKVTLGTTSGGTDIANAVDVGDILTYAVTLTEGQAYFATITPYNAVGDATGCTEATFTAVSAPACPNITTMVNSCGNFNFDVTWDAVPGTDNYNITVGTTSGGNDILDNVDAGTAITYTVPNTTVSTNYFYTVTATNSAGTSTCTEMMYTTAATPCYCESVPTSNDANGISNVLVGATNFPTTDVTYFDHTATAVDLGQGTTANLQITFETSYTYNTNIWVDLNDDADFEASELLFSGESLATNPTTFDASFAVPAGAALGNHRMRIGTADSGQATPNPCYGGSYGVTLDFTVNIIAVACTPGAATAMLSPDCGNNQFYVDVDVTTLGDATAVSDGATSYPVTATGTIQAGPYASNTTETLTLVHSDTACNVPLGNFSYICPPANDNCAAAEALTATGSDAIVWTVGTTFGNTASGELPAPSCSSFGSMRDVWYTATIPDDGNLIIETQANSGSVLTDTGMSVYSGTCGAFTQIDCNDDGGTGNFSLVTLTGQTPGDVVYIRVFEYANTTSILGPQDGPFEIAVHSASLGTDSFDANQVELSMYPNPVTNDLTITSQTKISNFEVYNLLGQRVMTLSPNKTDFKVNMANLSKGAYFVKLVSGSLTKTVKILKN